MFDFMYISSRNHKLKTYRQIQEESGYLVLLLMGGNGIEFGKPEKYMLRYYIIHDHSCMLGLIFSISPLSSHS